MQSTCKLLLRLLPSVSRDPQSSLRWGNVPHSVSNLSESRAAILPCLNARSSCGPDVNSNYLPKEVIIIVAYAWRSFC